MKRNLYHSLFFLLYIHKISSFNTANCSLNGEGLWAVGMVNGPSLFELTTPHDTTASGVSCIRNPIIACIDVTDIPAAFVADPFMYVEDNLASNPWYAFFEVKNMNQTALLNRRRGQIGAAVSTNHGKTWKYLQIVVVATVHLSYPFVFKHHNEYYMMPQGQSISYWKATSFPLKWTFHSKVHSRILNDATMVQYQGRWWLFALHEPNSNRDDWFLHILYSDSPLGPWHDTPNNCGIDPKNSSQLSCSGQNVTTPHRRGRFGVRPGGGMFVDNGKLYRMVQNSMELYGDSMDLYEITSLTTTGILEDQLLPNFRENFRIPRNIESWSNTRYHHLDLHHLKFSHKSEWYGLFDGDYNRGRHVTPKQLDRCQDMKIK